LTDNVIINIYLILLKIMKKRLQIDQNGEGKSLIWPLMNSRNSLLRIRSYMARNGQRIPGQLIGLKLTKVIRLTISNV